MGRKKIIKEPKVEAKPAAVGPCIECDHGYVMSDGVKENPFIILCKEDGSRYPQSWKCLIKRFSRRSDKMIIHPMIYVNSQTPVITT